MKLRKGDFVGGGLVHNTVPRHYRTNKLWFEISDQDIVRVSSVAFVYNDTPGYRQYVVNTTLSPEDFRNFTLFPSINHLVTFLNRVGEKVNGTSAF